MISLIPQFEMVPIIFGVLLLQLVECHPDTNSRSRRSVGGLPTSIKDHPYMVSIRYAGGHACGGTILSEYYVLTAAHCASQHTSLDLLYVKVGDTDINHKGSWYPVAEVVRHEKYPNFSTEGSSYDVSVLKLKIPIIINNVTTRSVELFGKDDDVQDYDSGQLVGWGQEPILVEDLDTKHNGSETKKKIILRSPSKLVNVEMNIAKKNKCIELHFGQDLKDMFCTYTLGKASCSGDSGGPLMVNGRQAGMVKGGNALGCNSGGTYSYLINIAKYREWIDEQINRL